MKKLHYILSVGFMFLAGLIICDAATITVRNNTGREIVVCSLNADGEIYMQTTIAGSDSSGRLEIPDGQLLVAFVNGKAMADYVLDKKKSYFWWRRIAAQDDNKVIVINRP